MFAACTLRTIGLLLIGAVGIGKAAIDGTDLGVPPHKGVPGVFVFLLRFLVDFDDFDLDRELLNRAGDCGLLSRSACCSMVCSSSCASFVCL